MSKAQRDIRRTRQVLEYAVRIRNIRKTCLHVGIPRSLFYVWRAALERDGEAGLVNKRPVARSHPRTTRPEVVEQVLHVRRTYHRGPQRIGLTGTFYTSGNEREPLERKESDMTKKRQTPEQIVTLLRQVEVAVANGKGTPQACKEAAITEQTYYRWRKEYGGLKLAQAKRLKELEKKNSRLKHVVAELSLEKQILREVAQGNS